MWLTVQDVDGTHLWEASNIEMELRALGQGNMAHPTQGQFCVCGDIKNRYNVDPDFSGRSLETCQEVWEKATSRQIKLVQTAACGSHAAQDSFEGGPTQMCKRS